MADFDSNRIKRLPTGSVKIKAEILNLDYNMIEEVEDNAFDGAEIAEISLKGNRNFTKIGEEAFTGLKNLRKLDLSETSISKLPIKGLSEIEVLKLVDTFSLKVFPSVYHFKYIKEAYLTYPYHCCAFKFPATHDPEQHANLKEFNEEMEKTFCANVTTPVPAATSTVPSSFIEPSTDTQPKQEDFIYNIYGNFKKITSLLQHQYSMRKLNKNWNIYGIQDRGYFIGTIEPFKNAQVYEREEKIDFGHLVYSPSPQDNSSQSWNQVRTLALGHVPGPHRPQSGFGRLGENEENPPHKFIPDGTFHVNTASFDPQNPVKYYCGNFPKNYREVKCYPAPDAFNPCEDVMGNVGLRIAVWFVVVAAMLGNLAVMVVLMSSRFSMSVSKFLMCNLATADFCMGLYLFIIAVVDLHTIEVYFNYAIDWQHGVGCNIAGFLTVFASELSIFTLTVITLERWYAITYAIHLNKRLKLGTAKKIMVCGWIYAITMATFPIVGISGYTKTSICLPMENKDADDLAYLITLLSINGLAFLLICACYAKMYLSITRQQSKATTNDTTVAKRMAMLVFTDFACWAPIAFFGLTAVAGYPLINVTNSKILLVFFYPLNSCANPFLYAILTKQYRRDFFILISRYGFCTKRAMKYKRTYSCNTHNRRTSSRLHHRGSLLTQVSFENARNKIKHNLDYDDRIKSISSTIDVMPDFNPNYQNVRPEGNARKVRKLSIVCEGGFLSSDDEESSSPMHKGSPHPIKNSYTKLNISSLEQEEILRRALGEDVGSLQRKASPDAEMLLWCSPSSSSQADINGYSKSSQRTIDTEM
ncbi:lutropin-choriogonadotropic hormone receptor-like [Limulus polyphemus]|uniref:Lutropin-choriogonadotropic hormone receptor-like n=1 Tax=Limulus polyphemus TaxID=6850 RepID=A0ABM1BE81_LIMPO|nr:lutropin-choriogonadotropic hormone receptor-like [Limulus polyphemus]